MTDRLSNKEQMMKLAEEAFKSAEKRDTASKQITNNERAESTAKTNKLRALRLAKEEADSTARKPLPNR